MATEAAIPVIQAKRSWTRRAIVVGPGLLFAIGSVGPRDLVSNSIAGANYGHGLLWLLVASAVARYVFLESSARYVMATGESLMTGCGRQSRWIVAMWFVVVMLKRHVITLLQLTLLGTAAHFALPLPTPHSAAIWGLCSWVVGFTLMYWGRYHFVEKFSRPLALVMGASLAAAAIVAKPDLVDLAKGVFQPAWPAQEGAYSTAFVLMAVMSAAVGSFSNLKYSAYVHEKGWRNPSFLWTQRSDLLVGMFSMFLMLAMVQIAAAGALRPRGLEVKTLDDLVPIFASVLGDGGQIIMGVALWSIVFSSYLAGTTGNGLMVSDAYYRFVRPSSRHAEKSRERGDSHTPVYRAMIIFSFALPVYVFLTEWTPIDLVVVQGAASVATLPIMILIIVRMTASRKLMGDYVNGWFSNSVLALTAAGALYLSFQGALELWQQVSGN